MARSIDTALVTGASAGIGRELAREFARHDFNVVLVARSAGKLRSLALELEKEYEIDAIAIPMDLAKPRAPQKLFDIVTSKGIDIDVLVNNAGIAHNTDFAETAPEDHRQLLQLNVISLSLLTRLFLPPMLERGEGRILNVASIFSFFPTPSIATYGASKAYVLSLSEALAVELKNTGVTVTALCPGYTETDMVQNAFEAVGKETFASRIPSAFKMNATDVAREGFAACMKGKTIHMDRLTNELTAQWIKLQPRWLVRNVTGLLSRLALRS